MGNDNLQAAEKPSELDTVTREALEKALQMVRRLRLQEVEVFQDWMNLFDLLRCPGLQQFQMHWVLVGECTSLFLARSETFAIRLSGELDKTAVPKDVSIIG